MTFRVLLSLSALTLSGLASAIDVRDIPALPLGGAAPASAASPPVNDPVYPSGYRLSQLQAAWDIVGKTGIPGMQNRSFDAPQGYILAPISSETQRIEVMRRIMAAGLPTGIVRFTTGPALPGISTLPIAPALAQPHRASLRGPSTLAARTTGVWTLQLTNTGQTAIHLEHGACDLKFEVINAAGATVRPAVTNTICTQQLVITDVAPGQTEDVLSFRWDGQDAGNNALPLSVYRLRAVFWDREITIRPPEVKVSLR